VVSIFEHTQTGHMSVLFVEMAWFKTLPNVPINMWADCECETCLAPFIIVYQSRFRREISPF